MLQRLPVLPVRSFFLLDFLKQQLFRLFVQATQQLTNCPAAWRYGLGHGRKLLNDLRTEFGRVHLSQPKANGFFGGVLPDLIVMRFEQSPDHRPMLVPLCSFRPHKIWQRQEVDF